jgi:hypothetical protein
MIQPTFNRASRLRILAELCTSNQLTPDKGNYAGFVKQISVTHLNTTIPASKELTTALTIAYRHDKWQSLLQEADTEPEPETLTINIEPVNERQSVQKEMQQIAQSITDTEPIKRMEHPAPQQQDKLTEIQTAKILYATAKHDTFDGVGRVILSEAREILDNKHLEIHELYTFWQTSYPLIEASYRSNVLLIYWDGKDSRVRTPIIPRAAPVFKPKNQPEGDIYEDTEAEAEATD